jgi:hypothetical protein
MNPLLLQIATAAQSLASRAKPGSGHGTGVFSLAA